MKRGGGKITTQMKCSCGYVFDARITVPGIGDKTVDVFTCPKCKAKFRGTTEYIPKPWEER